MTDQNNGVCSLQGENKEVCGAQGLWSDWDVVKVSPP